MESVKCPVCGASRLHRAAVAPDRLCGGPGLFAVWRCGRCGAGVTRPVPDDLAPYYPPTYGPHQEAGAVAPRRGLRRVVDSLATVIPPLPPRARTLEIGCGSGGFLRLLREMGHDAEGIEPSAEAARLAGARHGEFDAAVFAPASFDAIFGWMVLEHMRDPETTLRGAASILRPDGWLAISVPNLDSWEFSVFRDRWYALECPRHLTHFTPAALRMLLDRTGFDRVRILHQRNLSSAIGSAGYVLNSRRLVDYPDRPSRLLQAALYPASCLVAAFRRSGRITVLARRRA